MTTAWPAGGTVAFPAGLPEAGWALAGLVAGTGDALAPGVLVAGVVVPGARGAALIPETTAEATATGAPGAGTAGAAPGTALDEAPGTAPAHAVIAAIAARQPVPARPRRTPPRPRIDPMAHDASSRIPSRQEIPEYPDTPGMIARRSCLRCAGARDAGEGAAHG